MANDILLYNKERVFAFVLALGEVDDLKYAAAAGAINFGFPVIADTVIPEILPTGVTTYEHVVSHAIRQNRWRGRSGKSRTARAEMHRSPRRQNQDDRSADPRAVRLRFRRRSRPQGRSARGIWRQTLRAASNTCTRAPLEEVIDGKVEVVGPDFSAIPAQGNMNVGVVIKVAGRSMQSDFEPVLERQIHYFVNGASGIQHVGQRDIAWIRISNAAADKGFSLADFGKILHARFHADFGAIVDKVQVTIYTDPAEFDKWLENARETYDFRNKRLADLTDDKVEEFYSCTLCQSFAPEPRLRGQPAALGLVRRVQLAGLQSLVQHQPDRPEPADQTGQADRLQQGLLGRHERIRQRSVRTAWSNEVSMYSIMENPMTACGCFECIVMLDP